MVSSVGQGSPRFFRGFTKSPPLQSGFGRITSLVDCNKYYDDVTVSDVLLLYEGRLRELQAGLAPLQLRNALAAIVLAIGLGLFVALSLSAIKKQVSFLWPLVAIPVVVVAARRLVDGRRARYRIWRLKRLYQRAVERVNGNWMGNGIAGEEFI